MVSLQALSKKLAPKKGGKGDENKNSANHQTQEKSTSMNKWIVFGVIQAQGLKKAPEAVSDMEGKADQRQNVKGGYCRILQAMADQIIDRYIWVGKTEILQVNKNKYQQEYAGIGHAHWA